MSRAAVDYLFLYEWVNQKSHSDSSDWWIFFRFSCSLLISKNVETQTLEATSAIVQKRFAKTDYLSGKNVQKSWFRHDEILFFVFFFHFSWHTVDRTHPTRRFNVNCIENLCVFHYAGSFSRRCPEFRDTIYTGAIAYGRNDFHSIEGKSNRKTFCYTIADVRYARGECNSMNRCK